MRKRNVRLKVDIRRYKIVHDKSVAARLSVHKSRAKRRQLPFDLSTEQFHSLLSRPCFVDKCKRTVTGLDRIDSTKGYSLDNVRPCCPPHNQIRSNRSDAVLYQLAKEFTDWYESQR